MPNWCSTSYRVRGPKVQVDELFDTMTDLGNMRAPLLENGFGTTWLGCLVKELGGDPDSVRCRGSWSDLSRCENDHGVISFLTDTAWSRCDEVEDLILSVYPDLEIFFFEEELGNGVFATNDHDREFFTEDILIDNNGDMDYYELEGALSRLSEIKGSPVTSWDEAQAFCDDYNSKAESDDYIYIYRAEHV